MKKNVVSIYYFALLLLFANSACTKKQSYNMPPSVVSLYELMKEDSYNFSAFRSLVDRADLRALFNDAGEYTVFAPSNSAVTAAGYTSVVIQTSSWDSIQRLVLNHIVEGKVDVRAVEGTQEFTAISGEKILVQRIGDAIYVDGSDLTNPRTETTTNGTLNVINKLLVTRSSIMDRVRTYANATANSTLTLCVAAIERASTGSTNLLQLLSDPNTNYTFFAPNNGAFTDGGWTLAKIQGFDPDSLTRLLQYQMIPGRRLMSDLDSTPVNSVAGIPIYFDRTKATITTNSFVNGMSFSAGGSNNMLAGKGVVHTVSRIFPKPVNMTSLERIKADTSLTFFDAALTRASQGSGTDFVKMLSDPKASYTVYAINNKAFRDAGYAAIENVTNASAGVLGELLKFHFLPRRQNSINFAENGTVATILVAKNTKDEDVATYLTVTRSGGYKVKGPTNQTSAVVNPGDVVTKNGLVNVVDLVLRP